MTDNETGRLGLPLLQPAQAQKHVTVNESLAKLDGLVNLVLQSVNQTTPPSAVVDGECWGVPTDATGAWSGKSGNVAISSNGGWVFSSLAAGMRAFVVEHGCQAIFSGKSWVSGAITLGSQGSALMSEMAEGEVNLTAGAVMSTGIVIPAGVMVIGAAARVTSSITGDLMTWKLGTDGAVDRFGSGLGKSEGSWARGMLGTPMTYYQARELLLTAEGGTFSGSGRVRLAVHWWDMRLPRV